MGLSPNVDSPVTIGMVKPVILFPLDTKKYSASERGIICHELHHIINMDVLFRFLSFMIIAMEWYNPLVYYLFKELPFRKSVPTAYFPKFGEYLYIFLFFVQFEQLYLGFCLLNIEKI